MLELYFRYHSITCWKPSFRIKEKRVWCVASKCPKYMAYWGVTIASLVKFGADVHYSNAKLMVHTANSPRRLWDSLTMGMCSSIMYSL